MPLHPLRRGIAVAAGSAGVLAAALLGVLAGPAAAGAGTGTGGSAGASSGRSASSADAGPVVLLGTTGVRWSDVSETATPALARLAQTVAVANGAMRSVRPVACPADGWLAVSAGTRAADAERPEGCRTLAAPGSDGVAPGWADYLDAAAADGYGARPGLLGDLLGASRTPVRAFGPGAAIATATSQGRPTGTWSELPTSDDELATAVEQALRDGNRLVVVDLGAVRTGGSATDGTSTDGTTTGGSATGGTSVGQVDRRLAAALAGTAASALDPTVLVASLADRDDVPALQVVALSGPGIGPALARSSSTRQDGLVVGTDVAATLVDRLGLPSTGLVGAPVGPTTNVPADRLTRLVDVARHASVARPLVPAFYLGIVVLNLALYGVIAFGLARGPGRRARDERHRVLALRGLRIVGLGVAAVPVGLLLANLVPWWRAGAPAAALTAAALVVVALVVTLALAGPWRRSVLGAGGVVAAVTAVVVVLDVATGARLQLSAVIGVPTLAAGRFYGFNNTAFALVTASALFATSAVVDPWLRRRRVLAAVLVALVGLGLTVLDGAAVLGADFGGPPALIPAFTVLALLVGGAKVTWRRVGAVLAGAALVTAAFAVLDWTRPADRRTHLGQLVQTVLDGGLWPVITRKAAANLHIIANNRPLTVLTLVGVAFVLAALWRPLRAMVLSPDGGRYGWLSHGTALGSITRTSPALAPCLVATATAVAIGFAVNDSGIAIPALAETITVPLLVATCASWLLTLPRPADHGPTASATPGAALPGADLPARGLPGTDLPRADLPGADLPGTDLPRADLPGANVPGTDLPGTDLPGTDPSGADPTAGRTAADPARRRRWQWQWQWRWRLQRRTLAALALAAAALLPGAIPASAAPTPPTPAATTAPSAAAPVVLVGVTGLRWDDVGALSTPALWHLARTAAVGQVVVRSVDARACPVDGWLAVSSGERAADAAPTGCRTVPEPSQVDGVARVTPWAEFTAAVADQQYGARLGLLGDLVRDGGVAATAIGPGASIALATDSGQVAGRYVARPEVHQQLVAAVRTALTTDRLVVVDAGTLRDPGYVTSVPSASPSPSEPVAESTTPPGSDAILEPGRAEQAQAIDERVAAILSAASGTGARVLVVSLADSGAANLQLAVMTGDPGLLTSASTRQAGLFQVTDVLPTVLTELGLQDASSAADLSGTPITTTAGPATANARLAALTDADRLAVQITRVSGGFTVRFLLAQVLLALVGAVLLTWSGCGPSIVAPGRWLRPGLRGLRVAAVVLAAAPVASFLTRTVPWWRSSAPRAAFWVVLGVWTVAVAGAALLGPWRRSRVGPVAVVAVVTLGVLGVDAALGGRLVVDSPLGAYRLLGARFYGVSNQAFALLAVAGLITAGVAARALVARGRRTAASLAVAGIGLAVVVVDGMPGMGSDFGGPPALLPAFALLAFVVAGRRVRWRTVVVVLGAAAVVVLGFAVVDYLRPAAARTHLGRFVATVIGGGLWPVLDRKVATNLRLLASARYVLPTIAGTALTVLAVGGPGRFGPPRLPRGALAGLPGGEPLLRPIASAVAVAMGLAFAVNDSGVVIPATGLALAVPCLVALAAAWRSARLSPEPTAGRVAAPEPRTGPAAR